MTYGDALHRRNRSLPTADCLWPKDIKQGYKFNCQFIAQQSRRHDWVRSIIVCFTCFSLRLNRHSERFSYWWDTLGEKTISMPSNDWYDVWWKISIGCLNRVGMFPSEVIPKAFYVCRGWLGNDYRTGVHYPPSPHFLYRQCFYPAGWVSWTLVCAIFLVALFTS